MLTIEQARRRRLLTDWDSLVIPVPWFLGRRFPKVSVTTLVTRLEEDQIADERLRHAFSRLAEPGVLSPQGVYGFWPANSDGDDIIVYRDDARAAKLVEFQMLRQQSVGEAPATTLSLSDFVAPRESCAPDYIGAFAATLGEGSESESDGLRELGEDLRRAAMTVLANALVELVLQRIGEDWGFGAGSSSSTAARRGLRVSFGDPEAPDPAGRALLARLLHTDEIGLSLGRGFELRPSSAVTALCFAHPGVTAFDVGDIGSDQLTDYAARRNEAASDIENRLRTHRAR